MGLKYQEVCKVYITSGIIKEMKIERTPLPNNNASLTI